MESHIYMIDMYENSTYMWAYLKLAPTVMEAGYVSTDPQNRHLERSHDVQAEVQRFQVSCEAHRGREVSYSRGSSAICLASLILYKWLPIDKAKHYQVLCLGETCQLIWAFKYV